MPTVSVIIPTYNRGYVIESAIESVLAQTHRDFEIIVVDDGSTDDTKQRLSRYAGKIRCLEGPHRGAAAARNAGIRQARGEFVAFLDSDDIWLPEKLAKVVDVFQHELAVGMVTSYLTLIDEQDRRVLGLKPAKRPGTTYEGMLLEGSAQSSAVVIRRSSLDAVGLFDEEAEGMEDLELFLRVARRFRVVHLDEELGRYRRHVLKFPEGLHRVYRGFVRTYEKVLGELRPDELDHHAVQTVRRYLARSHYVLGVLEARMGRRRSARRHIAAAIRLWPMVGWIVEEQAVSSSRKLLNLLKPYGAMVTLTVLPWTRSWRQPQTSSESAA